MTVLLTLLTGTVLGHCDRKHHRLVEHQHKGFDADIPTATHYGLGRHIQTLNPTEVVTFMKVVYLLHHSRTLLISSGLPCIPDIVGSSHTRRQVLDPDSISSHLQRPKLCKDLCAGSHRHECSVGPHCRNRAVDEVPAAA